MPRSHSDHAFARKPILNGRSKRLLVLGLCLLLAAGFWFWWPELNAGSVWLWELIKDKEAFRDLLAAYPRSGPLLFIAYLIGQVLILPLPGEFVSMAAGYAFGWLPALIYSTIGLSLGSMLAFMLGRLLGQTFIKTFLPLSRQQALNRFMARRGVAISFILFLLPGSPRDYLCYLLGASPMHWRTFLLVSILGRLPSTLLFSLEGAAVYDEQWQLVIIMGLLLASALFLAYCKRISLLRWLKRLERRPLSRYK